MASLYCFCDLASRKSLTSGMTALPFRASAATSVDNRTVKVNYAEVPEKIVSRKPLGSLTSNARLFHSVS